MRLSEDFAKFLAGKKPGDQINFEINRNGLIKNVVVTIVQSRKVTYKLEKSSNSTPKQIAIYNKWISN